MRAVMSAMCVALLSVAACSETTATRVTSPLVGAWISQRETLHPSGTLTRYIGFSDSGTFTYVTNMYGIFPGQSATTLSAYTQTSGTYEIDGDKLVLTAKRIATWDSFYGAGSGERVEQVNRVLLDEARFRIVASTLIVDFVSYPADAPEPASFAFSRLLAD
jgi:hypothetical protein